MAQSVKEVMTHDPVTVETSAAPADISAAAPDQ
jgi:hypothetical protein